MQGLCWFLLQQALLWGDFCFEVVWGDLYFGVLWGGICFGVDFCVPQLRGFCQWDGKESFSCCSTTGRLRQL
jgi:hypothetical protein